MNSEVDLDNDIVKFNALCAYPELLEVFINSSAL